MTGEQQAAALKALGLLQAMQLALSALVAGASFGDEDWQEQGFASRAHVEAVVRRMQRELAVQLSAALAPPAPLAPSDGPALDVSRLGSGKPTRH